MKQFSRSALRLSSLALPMLVAANASALQFNLTFTAATTTPARDSFNAAAARWAALYSDPITINLNVGLASLGTNILGSTGSTKTTISYANVRSALIADASTPDDFAAVAGLQVGPSVTVSTNYFANNSNTDRSIPFNASITNLSVNTANAKALGLLGTTTAADGSINFATAYQSQYDYDPSDGIGSGLIDFTGIATHEIGHALGFVSGVDRVDGLSTTTTSTTANTVFASPLDLFRRSGASLNPDLTASTVGKYFSLDNGVTLLTQFSEGVARGDGSQASHWKDNLGLGIMDPTAANGELLAISANDRRAFDVMGYTPVPEPATIAALGLGALALVRRRRKSRA